MSGSTTLAVSNVVNATVTLAPVAAALRNFNQALIAGSTDVIDTAEAIRTYTSITQVAADFGTTAPEYYAAAAFFSQSPRPSTLKIARWAEVATSGLLKGGTLTPTQQLLSNFTVITAGAFTLLIDGVSRALSGINLSGATTLPGVAAIIQTGLTTWATCVWNAVYNRFEIKSTTTGATSTVANPAATALATALGITAAQSQVPVAGIALETPVAAAQRLTNLANDWYGLVFADTSLTPAQHQAVATYIEAASPPRIYAVSMSESGAGDPTSVIDTPYLLKNSGFRRSLTQYTTAVNFYAPAASIVARALTVDYTGSNTALTLKFKQEPGVAAEYMSQSFANAIAAKNCNIFVNYNNGTAILQEGVMASGAFIDEVVNLDWFQNYVQTAVYNLLYTGNTKIPQTDQGMHTICAVIEQCCEQAVTNGVCAPGVWNAGGFGQLVQGDTLPKGYYVYCPPLSTQSQADRETRKTPLIQIALKLAGAVHMTNVAINVNR